MKYLGILISLNTLYSINAVKVVMNINELYINTLYYNEAVNTHEC